MTLIFVTQIQHGHSSYLFSECILCIQKRCNSGSAIHIHEQCLYATSLDICKIATSLDICKNGKAVQTYSMWASVTSLEA